MEDCGFETSLGYNASSRPAIHRNTLSQRWKNGKKKERKEEKEKTAELRQILSYIITVRKYFFKA